MSFARRLFLTLPVAGIVAAVAATPAAANPPPSVPAGFAVTKFATAPSTTPATTGPDDITVFGKDVFVGWQNGVGSMGEPNPTTNQTYSRLVEYSTSGKERHSWLLTGKLEGLAANTKPGQLIATANEDGNSHLFTIDVKSNQITPYVYQPDPASAITGGVFTGGGTDGVSVINGKIFLSASNPGAANATAAFQVKLNPSTGVASLSSTFADNANAKDAVSGHTVTLALTDPDANAVVPSASPAFGSQFMLDAQGDQQLVFAKGMGSSSIKLTRLLLTHSPGTTGAGVDDVQWTAGSGGTLLIVDNGTGTIWAVKGKFTAGQAFASLDTVGASAKTNQTDMVNLTTGALTPFATGLKTSKGLVWIP
jgi:hypothetical protein